MRATYDDRDAIAARTLGRHDEVYRKRGQEPPACAGSVWQAGRACHPSLGRGDRCLLGQCEKCGRLIAMQADRIVFDVATVAATDGPPTTTP